MRRLVFLIGIVAALVAPAVAGAHPLGNFTVNRYDGIELSGNRVYVKYVLDMAEIPAFQERQKITDERAYERGLAGRIGRGLELRIARPPRPARTARARARLPTRRGGAAHAAFRGRLRVPRRHRPGPARVPRHELREPDRLEGGRAHGPRRRGRNVVLGSGDERQPRARRVPEGPPEQPARGRRRRRQASVPVTRRHASEARVARRSCRPAPRFARPATAGFAGLIARDDLGLGVILVSLALAFFWGSAHALSPGHGKAIVTAYLVGQRGRPRHAAALGLIVTATHTIGVFTLGFVTLGLSQFIVPEQLYPWIGLVSGLLVIGVGASVLVGRARHRRRTQPRATTITTTTSHGELGWRSLTAVGISGGLLPCPSALVVLLAAISLHRIALGLGLIVAFSAGLALSITGIGLAAILAKKTFRRFELQGRVIGLLPAISALVIVIAGAAMTVRAIPKVS